MISTRRALVSLALASVAGSASGEPRDFEARVSFLLPGLGERVVAEGQGVAQVEPLVPLTGLAFDGWVGGSTVVPLTDPLVSNAGLVALAFSATLRSGQLGIDPFAPPFSEPALDAGALALTGGIRLCLLVPDCSVGFGLPLGTSAGERGLGVGGILTFGRSSSVRLSLLGAPFTLATASARGETPDGALFTLLSSGSLHGPLSFTSTAALTLSGVGGALGLVTPLRIAASPGVPGPGELPGFARVEIELLPEPARWGSLGVAAAALLLAGRGRRLRSRKQPAREPPCDD